jgi:peptidoglycan/xylan/chitin deacetylase (PgdA/CDA1 family)
MDRRAVLLSLAGVLAAAGCGPASSTARGSADTAATPSASRPAPRPSATPPAGPAPEPAIARTPGDDIVHGPRDRAEVALTFHGAGDPALARRILKTCAAHDARITVFAVGQWIAGAPHMAAEILGAGHELGNHTWSHQQMKQLSAHEATLEVSRGVEALRKAAGKPGWWFRPSGTLHSTATIRAAAHSSGYQRCVSYDVDPEDFRDPGADLVRSRTLAAVKPGSIVSLHFGHEGTLQALPGILTGLSAKGLQPVTLSRLLRDA